MIKSLTYDLPNPNHSQIKALGALHSSVTDWIETSGKSTTIFKPSLPAVPWQSHKIHVPTQSRPEQVQAYQTATILRQDAIKMALRARNAESVERDLREMWGGPGAMSNTLWTLLGSLNVKREAIPSLSSSQLATALYKWAMLDRPLKGLKDACSSTALDVIRAYSDSIGEKLGKLPKKRRDAGANARRQSYLSMTSKMAAYRSLPGASKEQLVKARR